MKAKWIALASALAAAFVPASFPKAQMTDRISLPAIGAPAGSGELSPADEREIGESSMNELRESPYYLDDPDALEYLNRLGYRLVAMAPSSAYSFQFFPLKVPEINAFAMPGGFIAVFSGTVTAAQDESELAGVIAHEIAHVTQRHIARMFENQKGTAAATLGSFLLAILAASAGGSSGGDAAAAAIMGGQAAILSGQLKFSRSAEQEADRIGFQTMVRAGFDPDGMTRFFRRLQQRTGMYESAAYLSDHPLTVERISDMETRARNYAQPFRTHDNFDFHLMQARLSVLESGKAAGYEAAAKHYEEELKKNPGSEAASVLHYGLSVARSEMRDYKEALREAEKASELGRKGNVYLEKNLLHAKFLAAETAAEKTEAIAALKVFSDRNPVSAMAARTCIGDMYLAGDHAGIIRFLKHQTAISQENPDYFRYLARSSEALGRRSEAFLATGRMYALQDNWMQAAFQFRQAQRTADGDFFTMSEVDAALREAEEHVREEKRR